MSYPSAGPFHMKPPPPPKKKTTKIDMCTHRTQISLHTQSDQFLLSTRKNHSSLETQSVHSEDRSDWTDTYVDLIFPWEPSHFVDFVMRWLMYGKNRSNQQAECLRTYWRSGSVNRASGLRPGGCGFDPRSRHTKDFKNCISCSFVCAQH